MRSLTVTDPLIRLIFELQTSFQSSSDATMTLTEFKQVHIGSVAIPTKATGLFAAVFSLLVLINVAMGKGPDWKGFDAKSDNWFRSVEGIRIAKNVLSHQSLGGDWPKNSDTATEPFDGDRTKLKGTFDNGATVNEVRFLARAFRATGTAEYGDRALVAIDLILKAQYPNGGWPQSYAPGNGYARYITFNDNTMVNLMTLLREIATSSRFEWAGNDRRRVCQKAFDAGIDCILRCQITVDGTKTVWCAQHDEVTLEPRPARSFELVSLSGAESAAILKLLMSLEHPRAEVIAAVDAGIHWFETVRLTGIRETRRDGDKVIVADKNTPPIWARFYEIGTNRPIFSGRDGVMKYNINEIEAERRNGYAWYGSWGDVLVNP